MSGADGDTVLVFEDDVVLPSVSPLATGGTEDAKPSGVGLAH